VKKLVHPGWGVKAADWVTCHFHNFCLELP